jgi:hypothetical protein
MEEIRVQVPLEVAHALRKLRMLENVKKGLVRYLTPCEGLSAMSNQPSPDKTILAIRLGRPLKARLEKLALARKETVTDLVVSILGREVSNVELTPDDYRKIADEVEAARAGKSADKRLRAPRAQGGPRP